MLLAARHACAKEGGLNLCAPALRGQGRRGAGGVRWLDEDWAGGERERESAREREARERRDVTRPSEGYRGQGRRGAGGVRRRRGAVRPV